MPTSSSVNPELGVVTAANLLSPYAAVPSRDTDAEAFVSSLRTQHEIDALCEKYGVPKEFTARPAGDLRANSTPPPGAICVYARALKAGMRVPLHRFFSEVLAHFGIAPAQLTPNGWRTMAGFMVACRSAGVPAFLCDVQPLPGARERLVLIPAQAGQLRLALQGFAEAGCQLHQVETRVLLPLVAGAVALRHGVARAVQPLLQQPGFGKWCSLLRKASRC
ncbi:hypothetical protein VPH35_135610 [Triticum aestivum]